MRLTNCLLLFILLGIAIPSFASIEIEIANDTPTNCAVEKYYVKSGTLLNNIPSRIPSGDSKSFILMGGNKDIVLSLDCGGRKLSFETQEDAGLIGQGDVHPVILSVDQNLVLSNTWILGDFINMTTILWTIRKK